MRIEYRFPEGRKKALTFSYDDGNLCDVRLADIFYATGMKATFNLNSSGLNNGKHIAADAVKKVFTDRGFEVACHGKTHPFENQLPALSILEDVLEDRRQLEAVTGTIVNGMAYPFGTWNETVLAALKAAGIVYSRTTQATGRTGYFPDSNNWLTWHPTCHHSSDIMVRGKNFLENPYGLHMLYIWGHAYEFDNAGNWNIIEEFCDKMQNKPEIWYATNIRIHDYIEACRHLVTSADTKRIYNPSGIPVWVSAGEKTYEVPPAATVEIL